MCIMIGACNAGKCRNPMVIVNNNVRITGYEDPALEGEVITFTCLPGQMLNGTDTFICIRNGEWEPDPVEVHCTDLPTSITTGHGTHTVSSTSKFLVYVAVQLIAKSKLLHDLSYAKPSHI